MNFNRFAALCSELTIDPNIALENEKIVQALEAGNAELVQKLLKELF